MSLPKAPQTSRVQKAELNGPTLRRMRSLGVVKPPHPEWRSDVRPTKMQKSIQEGQASLGPMRGHSRITKPSREELNYARVFKKEELADKIIAQDRPRKMITIDSQLDHAKAQSKLHADQVRAITNRLLPATANAGVQQLMQAQLESGQNKSNKDTIASLKMTSLYNFLAQDFDENVKERMMGKLVFNPAEDVSDGHEVRDALQHVPDHLNYRKPANLKRALQRAEKECEENIKKLMNVDESPKKEQLETYGTKSSMHAGSER